VFDEGLNLAYTLFRVQVAEGCAAKLGRTVQDEAFGIAIKTALGEDGSDSLCLDGV
jgi:hypothetical protein